MGGKGSLGDLLAKAGVAVGDATAADDAATGAPSGPSAANAAADAHGAPAAHDGRRGAAGVDGRAAATHARDLSSAGKLVLRRERKGRGGKTVTVVDGLPSADLVGFARDLKKALGCGATVEDGSVVLLGDLAERARDWLAARGAKRIVLGN